MYNLLHTKLLLLATVVVVLTPTLSKCLYCTAQGLKYAPATSVIGCQSWELIGCLSVTFVGVSWLQSSQQLGWCLSGTIHVTDSLDGVFLGLFM